jgi:hypothetical protein
MKLLEILLLIIPPLAWKLWKDRNGTKHPNHDLIYVALRMTIAVFIIRVCHFKIDTFIDSLTLASKCYAVSITGFGLLFPYAFNFMWYQKYFSRYTILAPDRWYYVLNHLSETAIPDKYFLKYNVHWTVRLGVYIALFVLALIMFI